MRVQVPQIVMLHSNEVAYEWRQGLCAVKCSDDDKGIGKCTCWNIYNEKRNDTENKVTEKIASIHDRPQVALHKNNPKIK